MGLWIRACRQMELNFDWRVVPGAKKVWSHPFPVKESVNVFAFEKGYINLVPVVAHFQVPVDAQLIDVGDLCHVPHALIRREFGRAVHRAVGTLK